MVHAGLRIMKSIPYYIMFAFFAVAGLASLHAASSDPESYTFASQRQVGQVDHVNIRLEASGDLLTKSGTDEKVERQEVGLNCRRDYDEKTLQMPTDAAKTLRGVRYYRETSATLKKGTAVQNPTLRPENRTVGVEIVGKKATFFSPKGPFNLDELELVSTLGESLCLDQVLPGKPVKIGESWKIADDTIALLLGLDEITSNSLQMALTEVTPECARFELSG
jgi:hypothetical protein